MRRCRPSGAGACGISQWRVIGMPAMRGASSPSLFSQAAKSTVPGYGVSMTNCAKVSPARSATSAVASNVDGAIARQPEDERAEDVHAVLAERAQARDQRLADVVEALVDVLQAFGRDRLDADQRALDVGAPHRVEERRILGRLHRDLGEEHHVATAAAPAGPSARTARRAAPAAARAAARSSAARPCARSVERHRDRSCRRPAR